MMCIRYNVLGLVTSVPLYLSGLGRTHLTRSVLCPVGQH